MGVTFQQIQKYEKGRNRVSAARLTQIAKFLRVAPGYFFQPITTASDANLRDVDALVASKDGMDLIRAMMRIKNKELRRHIARLVEEIAITYCANE